MELKDIMNSPGLWGGAAVMMAALLGSCVFFLRAGLQRADVYKRQDHIQQKEHSKLYV